MKADSDELSEVAGYNGCHKNAQASWKLIIKAFNLDKHDFTKDPFYFGASQIRGIVNKTKDAYQWAPSILCKQIYCEQRPEYFIANDLFLLPVRNGQYAIIKGEGYVDIPTIESLPINYKSKLTFELETMNIRNGITQHLDYTFATSMLRSFLEDDSLVLTQRGKKYTPAFSFHIGKHAIQVEGVQMGVAACYEGMDHIVIMEVRRRVDTNLKIKQFFYPFRQWSCFTEKKVSTVLFNKQKNTYRFWQFDFEDSDDYNSIYMVKSVKYTI